MCKKVRLSRRAFLFVCRFAARFRGNLFLPAAQVRNSFPLISPWGQNFPANRALACGSHTLCDKGCRYPNFRRTSQRARKFGRRPQLRFACFCRWQRLSFAVLSVSRPYAHVVRPGLFGKSGFPAFILSQSGRGVKYTSAGGWGGRGRDENSPYFTKKMPLFC